MQKTRIFLMLLCLPLVILSCSGSRKTTSESSIIIESQPAASPQTTSPAFSSKNTNSLQQKYAHYLNVPPEQIQNTRLYQFIDYWLYTPYKWGGTDKNGIDCSAFIKRLLEEVYSITIPRTSMQQFFDKWIDRFGSKEYLSEGDLVFFRTMDDKLISHVGMYLGNRMFVNASSKGVIIASLDEPYWKRCYVAAGRVKVSLLNSTNAKRQ